MAQTVNLTKLHIFNGNLNKYRFNIWKWMKISEIISKHCLLCTMSKSFLINQIFSIIICITFALSFVLCVIDFYLFFSISLWIICIGFNDWIMFNLLISFYAFLLKDEGYIFFRVILVCLKVLIFSTSPIIFSCHNNPRVARDESWPIFIFYGKIRKLKDLMIP